MPARILPTAIKLLLLCLVVGMLLSVFGVTPGDLLNNFWGTVRETWRTILDFFRWGWAYVALGAIIVVPIWIIALVLGRIRR